MNASIEEAYALARGFLPGCQMLMPTTTGPAAGGVKSRVSESKYSCSEGRSLTQHL